MKIYLDPHSDKMNMVIASFEEELTTIRAGRANPNMLNGITIDYYGTQTPLSQVGNISIPEARIILIQPWDVSVLKDIEKSIQASNLGINPSNDGKVIRLVIPELTEDRRQSLSKDVKKMGEACKVSVRNIRRDAMDNFKKIEKDKEITEDERFKLEADLQKVTDKSIENIDKIVEKKTKEIMSV